MVTGAYNNQIHSKTNRPPNSLIFAPYHNSMTDIHYHYYIDDEDFKNEYDELLTNVRQHIIRGGHKIQKDHPFKEGMIVYRKILDTVGNNKKLVPRYEGPFKIHSINETTGDCQLIYITKSGREVMRRNNKLYYAYIKQLKLQNRKTDGN
uniref:Retrotransposable element n=1 Tax=Strongyloides stercoralis TaxID=6248 RepID=A0A0K0DTU4_STRER